MLKRDQEKCKKPTVLIWTDCSFASGHIIASTKLAHELKAQGCNVTIVTSQSSLDFISDTSDLNFHIIPDFPMVFDKGKKAEIIKHTGIMILESYR